MTPRLAIWSATAATVVVVAALAAREELVRWPPVRRVVVIHLDTTRTDDLGCYGGVPETPTIDAVAARGMRYTNSITTSPKTSPSIASFMTGRLSNMHGVYDVGARLDERLTTLAEILRAHGYATAGFTSNPAVGRIGDDPRRSAGFDQGFDVYETRYEVLEFPEGVEPNAVPRAHCAVLTDRALRFVEDHRDEPFFLWMLHLDPHAPYVPPESWEGRYLDHPRLLEGSVRLNPALIHHQAWVSGRLDSHEYVARHMAEVAHTDFRIGKLLERLAELPGRTLLVITADHGESLGDVNYWFAHGRNLRRPCLDVPLVIACDGLVPAGVSDALVANIDLAPTILEILGIDDAPLGRNGRSMTPTFREPDPWPDRRIPIQTHDGAKWRGVRSARYCLQSQYDADDRRLARSFLYDLIEDPGETRDVSERLPGVLEAHLAVQREYFALPAVGGSDLRHDPEMLRRLRALGYVR